MFGFPVNLQDNGVKKLTNDADSGFQKTIKKEIYYTIKDGGWSDLSIWQTASGRVSSYPTEYDDVYIRHNVIQDLYFVSQYINGSVVVKDLYISKDAKLSFLNASYFGLITIGNIFCDGTLHHSTNGFASDIIIYGSKSYINNFISSTTNYLAFFTNDNFVVPNINYSNVDFRGNGNKILQNDFFASGNVNIFGSFNLNGFKYESIGGTSIAGKLLQTGSGKLTFGGTLTLTNAGNLHLDLPGNPDVELKGGINSRGGNINSGTGTWYITTNNQTFIPNGDIGETFNGNILIDNNITLTISQNFTLYLNATINGITSTSKLLNRGTIAFLNLASVPSMTTGIPDFTTFANTIVYNGNYTATIPATMPTFHNLVIAGTGTKSLGVNTTLNGNYIQYGSAASFSNFEMGSYNFFVNGSTTLQGIQGQTSMSFKKSGSGNITFVGILTNVGNAANFIEFTGNPNVECRNGMNLGPYGWGLFNSGTGTWTFSTNDQEIFGSYNATNFSGPVLISGPITLTIRSGGGVPLYVNILNSINGNNASSKLLIGGGSTQVAYLGITNSTPIMSTGIFDFTTLSLSGISFQMTTAYSIPYNNFQHLQVVGSGKKSLSANTTILGSFAVDGEFDALNYDLSITGNTFLNNYTTSILRKTGAGSITFGGSLQAATQSTSIDFSGNPNVEFKNGFTQGSQVYTIFNSGTGIWKFSTNNQSIGGSYFYETMNCQILISGGITLTLLSLNNGGPIFTNVIDGDNVNSKFLMSASSIATHKSATQPMATGILDTFTNLNTWIYGNANQDIKGLPTTSPKQVYRNLTLNGGGTKTLQGYVSVLNTYTLTSPATLNNNGFTLTNP